MSKFIKYLGNASTTGWLNNKKIGRDVCVAAYQQDETTVKLVLESGMSKVHGVSPLTMTSDQFESFCEKQDRSLMLRALDLFGVETAF